MKSLGRGLNSTFLKISLLLLALSGSLIMVLGTPSAVKQSLANSSLYDTFTDTVIETTKKENQESGLPLERPEVAAAIKSAISPQFLQSSTEQVLDGTYRWLDGKTPEPDFKIDLAPVRKKLAVNLGDYAVTRAKGLPACSLAQLRQLQGSKIDPFNVPCLPPGVNPETLRSQVVADIERNQDFIKDPVITPDNLNNDPQGKTFSQTFEQAPKVFRWAKIMPFVFGGIALFSIAALVLLYDDRRRGFRAVGIILILNGLFLLVSTFLLSYFFARESKPGGRLAQITSNNPFETSAVSVVESLTDAINQNLYKFCAVYILLGAITLIVLRLSRPKEPKLAAHEHMPEEHVPTVAPGSTDELPPPAVHLKPVETIETGKPKKKS